MTPPRGAARGSPARRARWFRVTNKGKEIGRSYAEEYDAWLADLRARGREYESPPLHLVPGGHNEQRRDDFVDGA